MTTGATGSGRPRPLIKCVYLPVLQQSALVAEDREGGPAEPVHIRAGRSALYRWIAPPRVCVLQPRTLCRLDPERHTGGAR